MEKANETYKLPKSEYLYFLKIFRIKQNFKGFDKLCINI